VAKADVVLDCTDNMVTRQAINAACVALDTPLVTASAVGFGGQLMVLTRPGRRAAIAACGRIATNRSATAAPRGSSARWSA
jgi:molybdopterin/thiamine biosynthesis adenylyltransferase